MKLTRLKDLYVSNKLEVIVKANKTLLISPALASVLGAIPTQDSKTYVDFLINEENDKEVFFKFLKQENAIAGLNKVSDIQGGYSIRISSVVDALGFDILKKKSLQYSIIDDTENGKLLLIDFSDFFEEEENENE